MLIYFVSHVYKVLTWEIIVINWIDIIKKFKKRIIRGSYPNIHFHINYVWSFQEMCIYFDWPRHPNGWQWPMTGHYLQRFVRMNFYMNHVSHLYSLLFFIMQVSWESPYKKSQEQSHMYLHWYLLFSHFYKFLLRSNQVMHLI